MITKQQKQDWIKNLRSGKFKQGREFLRVKLTEEYSYCCLGVLMETLNFPFLNQSIWIPSDALDHSTQETLMDLNDRHRLSFDQIADWIEENIKCVDDKKEN